MSDNTKTKIIAVNEECDPPDLSSGMLWCVYSYTSGSYEGEGSAYAFDGTDYWETGLGHCSCYGPWEDNKWSKITKSELFEMHLSGDDAESMKIKEALATFGVFQ